MLTPENYFEIPMYGDEVVLVFDRPIHKWCMSTDLKTIAREEHEVTLETLFQAYANLRIWDRFMINMFCYKIDSKEVKERKLSANDFFLVGLSEEDEVLYGFKFLVSESKDKFDEKGNTVCFR